MSEQTGSSELHSTLLDALGAEIVSGRLPAGRVLTLEGLGAQHGISRTVAREAVRVLEAMGLVASRRRIGITVQSRETWNVFDPRLIRWRLDSPERETAIMALAELRRAVDPTAAALAARRADLHQCRALAAAASDMAVHAQRGDTREYRLAYNLFHRVVREASGNEMFRALDRFPVESTNGCPGPAEIAVHDELARAIRMHDEHAAEQAMRMLADGRPQAG